jgi:hydroxymethylpyrimidine pyrophosphatase-like HAD family hydrolase
MPAIIAVDFDDTLVWYDSGLPNQAVVDQTRAFQDVGAETILWTVRFGRFLDQAIKIVEDLGLDFTTFNENTPISAEWYISEWGMKMTETDRAKVFADFYVDDKSPNSIETFLALDPKEFNDRFAWRQNHKDD